MKAYVAPAAKTMSVPLSELYPVMREVLGEGGTFSITVRGNSMSPFLRDLRDQAVFAPLTGRRIRRGDIVFYQRASGQFVMHRVYSIDADGVMTIVGDAQWTLEPGIAQTQLRAYVTSVVRKSRTISCEKGWWRYLMTVYMLLRIRAPRLTRFGVRMTRYAVKLVTDPACVVRRVKRMLHTFHERRNTP